MKASDVRKKTPVGYEAIHVVGMGMSGTVYMARDKKLDRVVALKVLRKREDAVQLEERFAREARIVANNPHPFIVPILDANLEHDPPYMVFRWMEGGDLETLLEEGPVPVGRLATIGARLAGALEFLHSKDILHRDMKVGNVLLDGRGEAYLADLGLGRPQGESGLTRTGHVVGTYAYMAPEIFETGKYSARTDLFALGALLLELAQGHRLYAPAAQQEATQKALKEVEDKDLRKLLRRCLRTDPSGRPESAEEMARELEKLAASFSSSVATPLRPELAVRSGAPGKGADSEEADGSYSSEIAVALLEDSLAGSSRAPKEAAAEAPVPAPASVRSVAVAGLLGLALAGGLGLLGRGLLRADVSSGPVPPPPLKEAVDDLRAAPLLPSPGSGGELRVEAESLGAAAVVLTGRGGRRQGEVRWRHEHRAPEGGLVGLLAWGADDAGAFALFETRTGPDAPPRRLAMLWDADGRRIATLEGGGEEAALRPLALTSRALYLFLDGGRLAGFERATGAPEQVHALTWQPGLEVAPLGTGLAVREPDGRSYRLP